MSRRNRQPLLVLLLRLRRAVSGGGHDDRETTRIAVSVGRNAGGVVSRRVRPRAAVRGRSFCRLRFRGRFSPACRPGHRAPVRGRPMDGRVDGSYGRHGRRSPAPVVPATAAPHGEPATAAQQRCPPARGHRLPEPVAPAAAALSGAPARAAPTTGRRRGRAEVETEPAAVQEEPRTWRHIVDVQPDRRGKYLLVRKVRFGPTSVADFSPWAEFLIHNILYNFKF